MKKRAPQGTQILTVPHHRRTAKLLSRCLLFAAAAAPLALTQTSAQPTPEKAKQTPPVSTQPAQAAPPTQTATATAKPAKPTSPASQKKHPKISISADKMSGQRSPDGDTTVSVAEHDVVANIGDFDFGETRIEAAKATITTVHARNAKRTPVSTTTILHGETKVTANLLRILTADTKVKIAFDKQGDVERVDLDTGTFRLGSPPGYLQGTAFHAQKVADVSQSAITNATIYYHEPDFFSISVDASKITILAEVPAPDEKPPAPEKPAATAATATATATTAATATATTATAATSTAAAKSAKPPAAAKSGKSSVGRPASASAREAARDATLHVEDAVVRIAGIPIFYIPSYTQQGLDLPPLRPVVRAGSKDNIGAYLRTTTYYTGFGKSLQPGVLLDTYAKAGVLTGGALDYDFTKTPDAGPLVNATGDFQAAWINDNSNRGLDNYGHPIPNHRAFAWWRHKQTIPLPTQSELLPHSLELSANVHYWSDTSVLRDFRPDLFHDNQRPDNYVEAVMPAPAGYYLSAFARFRPNHFQNVRQRLPEVRFDMVPRPLFDGSPVYHRLSAAFAYLVEKDSPELPGIPQNLGGDDTLESRRLDGYYGFDAPLKIGDWFSFTPVAGARATAYFDSIRDGQGDPRGRVLPQLGFDMHLLANGQWNVQNNFWGINGLRHLVRPLVQYRWIPAAAQDSGLIPPIDRDAFVPYPPPLDLSQKRHADDLWEQQVFRVGIENTLQTRDSEYGSRDLAWLNIYQDFRDTSHRAGERYRSTLYTQLGLAPAYWLSLNAYNRLDTYNGHSNEISAYMDVHDGDRWRLWFGVQYCTDVSDTNQYYWGVEYRLNSNYALSGQWRFDNKVGDLTEQFYGLRQRLGNTWEIEWYIRHRRDARRDSGFSFGASLRLMRF
ncbi:MAG: hypothetical protein LBT53_07065 [Puniceicoccales bacterium]|jgi:LPS-assembly protein|nr:hypothetical protein [Puniceicoccales bacterium]